jgi:hypothetical protein
MANPAINAYEVSGAVVTASGSPTPVKRLWATGDTIATYTVVPAVTGKKIRVLQWYATTVDGLNLTFKSASTTIGANVAATGVMSSYCPHGWFETAAGEALGFALDAAESTSVHVIYVETA